MYTYLEVSCSILKYCSVVSFHISEALNQVYTQQDMLSCIFFKQNVKYGTQSFTLKYFYLLNPSSGTVGSLSNTVLVFIHKAQHQVVDPVCCTLILLYLNGF